MDDSATTATLSIIGANNDSLPDSHTEISVSGSGFPAGVTVALSVYPAGEAINDSVVADADGNIGWAQPVKPKLSTNVQIGVIAKYPSDPTDLDSPVLQVGARGKVVKIDPRPP